MSIKRFPRDYIWQRKQKVIDRIFEHSEKKKQQRRRRRYVQFFFVIFARLEIVEHAFILS